MSAVLGTSIAIPSLRNYYDGTDNVTAIVQRGNLYLMGGRAGADYACSFSYPV